MVFPDPSNIMCPGLSKEVLSWIRIGHILHLSKTTSTSTRVLSQIVKIRRQNYKPYKTVVWFLKLSTLLEVFFIFCTLLSINLHLFTAEYSVFTIKKTSWGNEIVSTYRCWTISSMDKFLILSRKLHLNTSGISINKQVFLLN